MRDDTARDRLGAEIFFEDRASDSPVIERVWRCHSTRGGRFLSIASPHWELVVTRLAGQTTVTARGPETKPTWADCPANGEWLSIRFKLGSAMRDLPVSALIDRNDVDLPIASENAFWLDGTRWTIPDFDDVETFVTRLVKQGLVLRDSLVEAALQGDPQALSRRTAQRRFLRATGMTQTQLQQIERARHATTLLRKGAPIAEVAHEAGFFDQAHLTRSLRRLIGQTPASIARGEEQLSFLYNTASAD
jgi:AraC-like DNA-binding protein